MREEAFSEVEFGHTVRTVPMTGRQAGREEAARLRSQTYGVLFTLVDPNARLATVGSAVSLSQAR